MEDTDHGDANETIRAVVRGECEYSNLRHFDVRISKYDDFWEIENPRQIFLEVAAEDVAQGLIHFRDNPIKLQLWAGFLLSSSSLIGLESLNQGADGEEILQGLWDAAFEGRFCERTFLLAQNIVSDGANRQ